MTFIYGINLPVMRHDVGACSSICDYNRKRFRSISFSVNTDVRIYRLFSRRANRRFTTHCYSTLIHGRSIINQLDPHPSRLPFPVVPLLRSGVNEIRLRSSKNGRRRRQCLIQFFRSASSAAKRVRLIRRNLADVAAPLHRGIKLY